MIIAYWLFKMDPFMIRNFKDIKYEYSETAFLNEHQMELKFHSFQHFA
jgi:competence transcription factor ComK